MTFLESNTQIPARHQFDLFAGTSTGMILACALAHGTPASRILWLYKNRSEAIFPTRSQRIGKWFRSIWHGTGTSQPKYGPEALRHELEAVFKGTRLGELKSSVMGLAYDVDAGVPVVFKSWGPRYQDVLVVDACMASAAAPAFFPGVEVMGRPLIDGGVAANNPSVAAMAEGLRLWRHLEDFKLLSIGTGRTMGRGINIRQIQAWGLMQWAPHMVQVLMDGPNEVAHYACRQVLQERYLRVNPAIHPMLEALDKASNAPLLERSARKWLHKNQRVLRRFCEPALVQPAAPE